MGSEPQTFDAPDGTRMVVLTQADYQRLRDLAQDAEDVFVASGQIRRIEAGEGTMPSGVLDYILDEELHPVAAWRKYRGFSQSDLAQRAGLSQVWISRIETGSGYGTPTTRRKLGEALNAPLWALEDERDQAAILVPSQSASSRKGRKYRPLGEFLAKSGRDTLTLTFKKIDSLVGGLPKSASVHREWWANHAGNSQAIGWLSAGYDVEPDQSRKTATFRKNQR